MKTPNSFPIKILFLLCFCFFSAIKISHCWWNEGHMIVANIAKKDLLQNHPEAYYLMNNITIILNDQRHDELVNFVESATWPDLVKGYHLNLMDAWHFRDIPVNYSDPNPPVLDHTVQNNALYFIVN